MSKPILFPISAFDKNVGATLTFSYSGNQSFKNKVVIKDNETDSVVYSVEKTTFQLRHTLEVADLGSLDNGKAYNATVQVFDESGVGSAISTPVLFYCFTTPTFSISNITENQVVQSSYLPIQITYSQTEGEQLNSYKIQLYDAGHQEISSSELLYNIQADTDLHTFYGLYDNTSYYVRATGSTLNGFQVDTGYILFSVEYITPAAFYLLELHNQYDSGSTQIKSNIIMITGKSDSDEYIDGKMLVLTDGKTAIFDEGYFIEKDFALYFSGSLLDSSRVITLSGSDSSITLSCVVVSDDPMDYENSNKQKYISLQVASVSLLYEIHSDKIDYDVGVVDVVVRRKGNLFSIDLIS